MSLKELLARDFGVDFPISGGTGQSRDNPIVIHRRVPNDYTSVEHGILQCLGIGRGVEWRVLQQALLSHNGRSIDQIKVETVESREDEIVTQVENYYFDVTECI